MPLFLSSSITPPSINPADQNGWEFTYLFPDRNDSPKTADQGTGRDCPSLLSQSSRSSKPSRWMLARQMARNSCFWFSIFSSILSSSCPVGFLIMIFFLRQGNSFNLRHPGRGGMRSVRAELSRTRLLCFSAPYGRIEPACGYIRI